MIKPLFNYVVAEIIKESEKVSDGGIVVIEHVTRTQKAKVLAIGESIKSIKVNDTILITKDAGIEINNDGKEALMLRCNEHDTEILAVL